MKLFVSSFLPCEQDDALASMATVTRFHASETAVRRYDIPRAEVSLPKRRVGNPQLSYRVMKIVEIYQQI